MVQPVDRAADDLQGTEPFSISVRRMGAPERRRRGDRLRFRFTWIPDRERARGHLRAQPSERAGDGEVSIEGGWLYRFTPRPRLTPDHQDCRHRKEARNMPPKSAMGSTAGAVWSPWAINPTTAGTVTAASTLTLASRSISPSRSPGFKP